MSWYERKERLNHRSKHGVGTGAPYEVYVTADDDVIGETLSMRLVDAAIIGVTNTDLLNALRRELLSLDPEASDLKSDVRRLIRDAKHLVITSPLNGQEL